jgi:DNA transposase THAP9
LENNARKKAECEECVNYLFTLQIAGKPLVKHQRRTFIIGFAAAVKSVFAVASRILNEMPQYKTIETFQFSQDFLECFFGIVRSRLGGNNNPTVLEFKYALRRILFRNNLQGIRNSNVEPVGVSLGSLFSLVPVKKPFFDEDFADLAYDDPMQRRIMLAMGTPTGQLEALTEFAVYYIGGWVVNRYLDHIDCESCERAMVDNAKDSNYTRARLVAFKNREDGRQIYIAQSAFQVRNNVPLKTSDSNFVFFSAVQKN